MKILIADDELVSRYKMELLMGNFNGLHSDGRKPVGRWSVAFDSARA